MSHFENGEIVLEINSVCDSRPFVIGKADSVYKVMQEILNRSNAVKIPERNKENYQTVYRAPYRVEPSLLKNKQYTENCGIDLYRR